MNGKIQLKEITSLNDDFAQWYTDVVIKADLCDYTSVKGCMVIKPYGYAIWENIRNELDKRFKEKGIENVYLPMFIPESLLNKEKDHIEGFAPEVAWVTHGGSEELEERLCIRPTSETLFCDFYSQDIRSWRDLPKLYNQWCSVVRWEKTTRPFLRSREFLWQEGHTVHLTAEDSEKFSKEMLDLYGDFIENFLAIPVIRGQKTDKEKFAGAQATYTIEALMHDGKALQAGTSHDFGKRFSEAFKIQYLSKNNQLEYVYQTSWGMTTRLIGAIIMVHGDNSGLILPPLVAPYQIAIIPIRSNDDAVMKAAENIKTILSAKYRILLDSSEHRPGYKFSEQEIKGIPLRIEIGPQDVKMGTVTFVRRDNSYKTVIPLNELINKTEDILNNIQQNLFQAAKKRMEGMTHNAVNLEDFIEKSKKPGLIKAMWCGCRQCEEILKEKAEVSSRCIPFENENIDTKCVVCGKLARKCVVWGKAY